MIVDLAAETGGEHPELTQAGETVVRDGMTIVGPVNLPASMPDHASSLYSRNVKSLLELMVKEVSWSTSTTRCSPAPASCGGVFARSTRRRGSDR